MSKKNGERKGFTLIELLVSILVFSLLIGIVSYSFSFFVCQVKRVFMPYPEKAVAFLRLNRVVSSAFFYVRQTSLPNSMLFSYLFQGTPKYMVFVSATSSIIDNLALCKLCVEDGNLILQEYPLYSDKYNYINPNLNYILKYTKPKKEIKILGNVKKVKIVYYKKRVKYNILKRDIPQEIDVYITLDNSKIVRYIFHIESDFYNKKLFSEHLYRVQKNGL